MSDIDAYVYSTPSFTPPSLMPLACNGNIAVAGPMRTLEREAVSDYRLFSLCQRDDMCVSYLYSSRLDMYMSGIYMSACKGLA